MFSPHETRRGIETGEGAGVLTRRETGVLLRLPPPPPPPPEEPSQRQQQKRILSRKHIVSFLFLVCAGCWRSVVELFGDR